MISNEILLQLIQVITLYCGLSGAGPSVEQFVYPDQNFGGTSAAANRCFKKVWHCGHNTKDASILATNTHNCISKHVDGELK